MFFHVILILKQNTCLRWTVLALNFKLSCAISPCIHSNDFLSITYAQFLNSFVITCFVQLTFSYLYQDGVLVTVYRLKNLHIAPFGYISTNLSSNYFSTLTLSLRWSFFYVTNSLIHFFKSFTHNCIIKPLNTLQMLSSQSQMSSTAWEPSNTTFTRMTRYENKLTPDWLSKESCLLAAF